MTWTLGEMTYDLDSRDGLPVLYAGSDGRPQPHDYDLAELAQLLVPYILHVVHDPPAGLVGEFRTVAGHPVFVGLCEPREETTSSGLLSRAGGHGSWTGTGH